MATDDTRLLPVRRLGRGEPGGFTAAKPDPVAVEAPLELRIGKASTVLMRTPGADEDLVYGHLFAEGFIERAEDVRALTVPPGLVGDEVGNVVAAELARPPAREGKERLFYASSACGVCGKPTIASLALRAPRVASDLRVAAGTLLALPARMRVAQATFEQTGGVHAAALFDEAGRLVALREDVGRHNALDKLVGAALRQGELPLRDRVLLVSGRVSYELMQKAITAGIPVVAAVGAPSTLAVDLAEQFDVTLVAFLRDGGLGVYAGTERIAAVRRRDEESCP